jgi:hypothetical protein
MTLFRIPLLSLAATGLLAAAPAALQAQAAVAVAAPADTGRSSAPYVISSPSLPAKPKTNVLPGLLVAEVNKANAAGKDPVVYIYSEKSAPQAKFHQLLTDSSMTQTFRGIYVIELDVNVWRPYLKAAEINVTGLPAFFAIDKDGKGTGKSVAAAKWGDDTPTNMVPVLKSFFESSVIRSKMLNDYTPPMLDPYSNSNDPLNPMGGSSPGLPGD